MRPIALLALTTVGLLAGHETALAQPTTPEPPRYSAPRFGQLTFENDVLQLRRHDERDGNFTNGVRLDLMGNFWKRLPTRFLLLEFPKPPDSQPRDFDELYTFSIGQEMYTPRSIVTPTIDPLDRPYAGWLYISSGLMKVDVKRARKLTSSLSLGVVGPASLAAETQTFVHDVIDSPRPAGWRHQVRNSVGLSYMARYEARPFPQLHRAFDLFGLVEGHAGTVTNYVGGGFTLRIGQFNDYFENAIGGVYDPDAYVREERNAILFSLAEERRDSLRANNKQPLDDRPVTQLSNRRFQMYFFIRPVGRIILDNSYLQGGWLRRDNPHTIRSEDLSRFVLNVEYGGVIAIKRFQLTYTQSFRTREFNFGDIQQWGRISLLVGLQYGKEKRERVRAQKATR